MANSKRTDCRDIFFVLGDVLMTAMTERDMTVSQLATRARVAEQTVRNYLNSTKNSPWPVDLKKLRQVCEVLKLDVDAASSEQKAPTTPHESAGDAADLRFRFVGNPETARSIQGVWDASSIDVEVPGVVTYTDPSPWAGRIEIRQYGNRFEAAGRDMDDDGVFAVGTLLEDGNWVRFEYWIDNDHLREYGTAMVEHKGCGKEMEGVFIGRDHGHSSNGIVVAHLTLKRDREASEAMEKAD